MYLGNTLTIDCRRTWCTPCLVGPRRCQTSSLPFHYGPLEDLWHWLPEDQGRQLPVHSWDTTSNYTYTQAKRSYKHVTRIEMNNFREQEYLQGVALEEGCVHRAEPVEVEQILEVYHDKIWWPKEWRSGVFAYYIIFSILPPHVRFLHVVHV